MIIKIRVTPNAKASKISNEGDFFKVKVLSRAESGRANKELIILLARYFQVSKSLIIIKKGEKVRNKVVEIIGVKHLPNKQISLKI